MRARWLRVLLFLVLTGAGTVSVDVRARPGGGGSYHGGGGSLGGGGHSGGFGGSTFGGGGAGTYRGWTPSTGDATPGLIIFAVVAVVLVIIVMARRQRLALSAAQYEERAPARSSDPLAPLREQDPGLTEQSIVDHVQRMAELLRTAWCNGDMRPARAFVSDGVFSRFQVQLELMRQEGRRNVMGDARLLDATIEAIEDAPPLDVVHVRVNAEARDTEVPVEATDDQIRTALLRTRIEPYVEIWSLVRRRGVTSKPAGFDVGRACPSCGAPLSEGETIKCRYCGALVCSGQHDWVLAEITQLVEWRRTARREGAGLPPGLDELRARDPGVAREVLEDRASYLFWKWVQAGRAASVAPLRKCAAPELLAQGAHLERTRGASDVAVGSADLLSCEANAANPANANGSQGFDLVRVQISWSARFGGVSTYTPMKTMLLISRKSSVTSKPSMTALVCQACGAPLVEGDSSRCDYCGAELACGDQAWALAALG